MLWVTTSVATNHFHTLGANVLGANTLSVNMSRFDMLTADVASAPASILAVTLAVSDGLHHTVRKTFRALALPTRLHC